MADNKTSIVISAEDKTSAALASVRNGFAGLTQSISSLDALSRKIPMLGTGLASAFGGLAAAAAHTVHFAAGLNDMAMQTGATVEQLSALRNVAELNSVSLEDAGKALGKLSKNMAEAASGGKEQIATFAALGVAFKKQTGALRESGDVMLDVAKAIAEIESPTERVAAAQLAFGKSGASLVPMLMDLAREGKLTATITAEQAEAADRFEDSLTRMKQSLRGMAERFGAELIEPLARFSEEMEKATRGGNQKIEIGWVDRWINALATKLAQAEKTWSQGMANFWGTVGASGRAEFFTQQAAAADAALQRLGIERRGIDERDVPLSSFGPGTKSTGGNFAKRLAEENAKARKTAKAKDSPFVGLAGFDDNRSAKEIMAELHAQDKALESLRDKYIQLIDPVQKYREELDEIDRLEQGGTLSAAEALEARWKVQEKISETVETTTDKLREQKDVARELGMTFQSAFEDAIVEGKKFSEVLQGLAQDVLRLVMRKNVTEPLAEAVGSIDWGSLFSFNADGAVYSGPGISAYSGQIVSRPTVFPFASGIGLMGEAGPEAILPLRRGADGKLGVSGGGVVVNVIEAPGRGGQQQRRNEGGVNMIDIFVEQIKASIAGDVANGRGLIPASFEGAYGLNRGAGAY